MGNGLRFQTPQPLERLAMLMGAQLQEEGPDVEGLGSLEEAVAGQLSFYAHSRYKAQLMQTRASAVVAREPVQGLKAVVLLHPDPLGAMGLLLDHYFPAREAQGSIHPTAVIASDARIEKGVEIGPHVVIASGAQVGGYSILGAGVYIGEEARVGGHCRLEARVCVMAGSVLGERVEVQAGAVIGAEGFGYRWDGAQHRRLAHRGWVEVGDDVVIGANCTIARGMLGATRIGKGAKLDNLVQIGHQAQIGEHCLLMAQVGVSGSVRLEQGVVLAGQVGVADHARVGAGVQVAAQSGVHGKVEAGKVLGGTPAIEHGEWRRAAVIFGRLPRLWRELRRGEEG
ncbi:MAG: UDP-3-O-(3-hydroxymyristoyl)glucosamine N-acyltransferase [Myxococcota bacterium]